MRKLLLAVASSGVASVHTPFEEARREQSARWEALKAALGSMAGLAAEPDVLVNHLGFLQLDIRDPEFHVLARRYAQGMRQAIEELLSEAQRAGEVGPGDITRLARSVEITYNGAMLTWAFHREGSAAAWLEEELDVLLAPWTSRLAAQGAQRSSAQ